MMSSQFVDIRSFAPISLMTGLQVAQTQNSFTQNSFTITFMLLRDRRRCASARSFAVALGLGASVNQLQLRGARKAGTWVVPKPAPYRSVRPG